MNGIDPMFFTVNWELVLEAVGTVVLISFIVERSLAVFFESRWYIEKSKSSSSPMRKIKEPTAYLISLLVCLAFGFNMMAVVFPNSEGFPAEAMGFLLTAGVIAGGSKGSIRLFRDLLGFQSNAYKEKRIADGSPGRTRPEAGDSKMPATGETGPPRGGTA